MILPMSNLGIPRIFWNIFDFRSITKMGGGESAEARATFLDPPIAGGVGFIFGVGAGAGGTGEASVLKALSFKAVNSRAERDA